MKKVKDKDIEKAFFEMTIVDRTSNLVSNIEKVIIGKHQEVIWAVALLSDRHILIEDVPGIGKTMLAKAIAGLSMHSLNESSSLPICCPTISRVSISIISPPVNSGSGLDPYSRMCSSGDLTPKFWSRFCYVKFLY